MAIVGAENEPPYDRAFLVVPRYRFRDNEAYGRQFRRNLPQDLAERVTLLDDQAFLRQVAEEITAQRVRTGSPRTEGGRRA